jgi:hypothetical protein
MADIPEGYMEAADGKLVPVAKVQPQHMLEDEMVRQLAGGAVSLNEALAAFKSAALDRAGAFMDLLAQEYGTHRGGREGNVTFRSYDGRLKMQVSVAKNLAFGPELQMAKALIDGCIERWSEGANDNIRVLVNDAFQVNKAGRIDTQRVLGLRRLQIEDAAWQRAMKAIADALTVQSTRTYLRFYTVDKAGVERAIPLDLAAL